MVFSLACKSANVLRLGHLQTATGTWPWHSECKQQGGWHIIYEGPQFGN